MKKRVEPRTFEHFPKDAICPACQSGDDRECVLLGVDATEKDGVEEAQPFHLDCTYADRYHKDIGLIYRKLGS